MGISVLNYFPRLRRLLRIMLSYFHVSVRVPASYIYLKGKEADVEGRRLRNSWQDISLPQRQWELVESQLHQFRMGARVDVFDVFVNSIKCLSNLGANASLLEVGCASGFYSEVLGISGLQVKYSGCDYSDSFIKMAKERYPSVEFKVEDATEMHFEDGSFDIVLSGCCLLHIPEYVKGVEEAVRVARSFVIFHRTPVVWGQPERWFRKQAYGVETVEIHFNERDFLVLLAKNGLELIAAYTLSEEYTDVSFTQGYANRTYVCRKKSR